LKEAIQDGSRREAEVARMKRNTGPRRVIDRHAAVERVKFAQEFPFCWHCGSTWNLTIDEIVSGMSDRVKGVQHRLAWTRLCNACNTGELNGSAPKILLAKLVYKLKYDAPHFDLPMVCVLRGRAPGAIELTEVMIEYCRRYDGGPNG